MFSKEIKSMMTKKFDLYNRLFVSNRNFTTKHVKIVKNSRFFQVFPGLQVKWQPCNLKYAEL